MRIARLPLASLRDARRWTGEALERLAALEHQVVSDPGVLARIDPTAFAATLQALAELLVDVEHRLVDGVDVEVPDFSDHPTLPM